MNESLFESVFCLPGRIFLKFLLGIVLCPFHWIGQKLMTKKYYNNTFPAQITHLS